jgi:hypothetical protein
MARPDWLQHRQLVAAASDRAAIRRALRAASLAGPEKPAKFLAKSSPDGDRLGSRNICGPKVRRLTLGERLEPRGVQPGGERDA